MKKSGLKYRVTLHKRILERYTSSDQRDSRVHRDRHIYMHIYRRDNRSRLKKKEQNINDPKNGLKYNERTWLAQKKVEEMPVLYQTTE